jgi:hypothetical protein
MVGIEKYIPWNKIGEMSGMENYTSWDKIGSW